MIIQKIRAIFLVFVTLVVIFSKANSNEDDNNIKPIKTIGIEQNLSGTENKIEAFIDMIRPLGILELVRTGRIAMVRGSSPSCENSEMEPSSET